MTGRPPRTRRLLGYLLAPVCLIWIFHDIRLEALLQALAQVRWGWVPAAIALDTLSYVLQGWRWSLLLRPTGWISPLRTTQAVYAGLFLNETLPMRAGEVYRGYLISRWRSIEIARVVPSMAIERLLDGVWLAVAIAGVAAFVPLPRSLVRAGDVLGGVVLAATGLFVLLLLRRSREAGTPATAVPSTGPFGRIRVLLRQGIEGVRAIGLSRQFLAAAALSAALLILQGLAFWLLLRACRIGIPPWSGIAVFLLVHFGTALPNTPGNIGTYQLFCVLGLALFGADKARAAAFSVVAYVLLTLPLWGIGYWALRSSGARPEPPPVHL
jgi:hypothetical protein